MSKKNFLIGWVFDYTNKFSIRARKSLMQILINTSVLRPQSIAHFLDELLLETKKYQSMVIWFKPALCYTLIIKRDEGVKLLRDSKDLILECKVTSGKSIIKEETTTGEGLAVFIVLFIEILKNKTTG